MFILKSYINTHYIKIHVYYNLITCLRTKDATRKEQSFSPFTN